MSVAHAEILESVQLALHDLNESFVRKEYKNVPKIWHEIWFIVRADVDRLDLPVLRERFGHEIGRLIGVTRLHIQQKRISGDVSPRLQSIAAKIGK